MAEVSIFWTATVRTLDGGTHKVRCKARIDYLKPRGIGDLKSVANERRRPFPVACRLAIRDYRHDLQVAHYLDARAALPALVAAKNIFVKGGHSAADLERIVEFLERVRAVEDFAFQFVFFQKSGAPRTWSCVYSPENKKEGRAANPLLVNARLDRTVALATYAEWAAKAPAGEAWIEHDPVLEADETEMPMAFLGG
jgi:hypothetical protein